MKGYLLDVNVLLALAWPNHVHHLDATRWLDDHREQGWATCAVTELGFVRLSAHPRFSPNPRTPQQARALLGELTQLRQHHYWQEEKGSIAAASYDAIFANVLNHELVTDGFLVAVAQCNGGKVATFDRGLKRIFGDAVILIGEEV